MKMPTVRKELGTIIAQVTSARWIIAIGIIWTICYATTKTCDMMILSLTSKTLFLAVKEVFVYMMGIVSGIAGSVVVLYYTRSDRGTNGKPAAK